LKKRRRGKSEEEIVERKELRGSEGRRKGDGQDFHSIAHNSITTLLKSRVLYIMVALDAEELAFALSLYMYGCHIQSSGKRGQPKWKGKK
jgi:hypothetical protein